MDARTWVTYGNPFYPVTTFGFAGRGTQAQVIIGPNKPTVLDHQTFGSLGALFTSWADDLHRHTYSYARTLGGLGPQWLLLLLPALIVAVVLITRHRRDFAIGVVVPVLAICAASGAAWWARYTITLAAAGCIAVAYWLQRWSHSSRPAVARLAPLGATAFVAVNTVGVWWATAPTVTLNGATATASVRQVAVSCPAPTVPSGSRPGTTTKQ